jgi:lysophospholipase L1-like esterase
MLTRRAALTGALATPALVRAAQAPHVATPLAARPLSRADLPWWKARHEAKLREKAERGRIDLVFLGDSITQQYEHAGPPAFLDYVPVWERFYGDRRALNLGFKGDATSHLLWRIENGEVAGIAPRAAVALIGANNFGHLHWPAEATIPGIEAVVAATRAALPRTPIVLLAVLPSDRGPWVADNTLRTNRALVDRYGHRGEDGVTFVDVNGLFVREGRIDTSQFADPLLPHPAPALHPTAAAQARMAAALEPTIMALLGDRDHRT